MRKLVSSFMNPQVAGDLALVLGTTCSLAAIIVAMAGIAVIFGGSYTAATVVPALVVLPALWRYCTALKSVPNAPSVHAFNFLFTEAFWGSAVAPIMTIRTLGAIILRKRRSR